MLPVLTGRGGEQRAGEDRASVGDTANLEATPVHLGSGCETGGVRFAGVHTGTARSRSGPATALATIKINQIVSSQTSTDISGQRTV
jgi:hypothetical protein